NSLSTIGLITAIIFTIIFISSLSLLFIYREKKNVNQPKEKSTSGSAIFSIFKNAPFYIILILYLIFTLLPVYLAIKVSLSSALDIANNANPSDPWYSLILNYSSVMFSVSVDEPAFYTAFMNSIFIGLGTGLIGLLISVSAAYSLARFKFKGNSFMTYLILATQMFPGMILLIPQYVIWKNLGLLTDSMKLYGVLLASSTGSVAYCTWMMKGYFQTVPVDIEEAAIIDGATRFKTFAKIALPLVKSGMVAVMIFTFLTSWQDFVLARTFIGETDPKATLPLLFYNFQNTAAPDIPVYYELLAPYSILVALPVVIFFMLLQKQLAAGAVAGSVK
ncbi:MAG: carbohydrate ABC transporter permease, partial [Promethearchaeota archaeon]